LKDQTISRKTKLNELDFKSVYFSCLLTENQKLDLNEEYSYELNKLETMIPEFFNSEIFKK
jgi:hypothetical protein